jgi:hypothetical protein
LECAEYSVPNEGRSFGKPSRNGRENRNDCDKLHQRANCESRTAHRVGLTTALYCDDAVMIPATEFARSVQTCAVADNVDTQRRVERYGECAMRPPKVIAPKASIVALSLSAIAARC